MTPSMRTMVLAGALAVAVLTALAACEPTPQEKAAALPPPGDMSTFSVTAEAQAPSSCGGDLGMATQFYRNQNGARSMGPPASECP